MARESMAQKLKRLRELRGWSQAEMARRVGMQPGVLSRYESGKRDAMGMSVEVAVRFARVLGVSLDYLAGTYEED